MDRHQYKNKDITVIWEPQRCIHSAECVRHLGAVFEPASRPWVRVDAEPPADIAKTIQRCPTGALHYQADDPAMAEQPDDENTVITRPHGPLFIRGRISVGDLTDTRVALCRCGASARKPFCDNSHLAIGFADSGRAKPGMADGVEQQVESGPLRINPIANGPLHLEGPVVVANASGEVLFEGSDVWLCRCGASVTKPFCDGSHTRAGFSDASLALQE